jgi:hypothetical protein
MNGYVCFYNGKRLEVYAASLLEAKNKAVAHFKPAKSKVHMVTCMLAEKDGRQITHTPDF